MVQNNIRKRGRPRQFDPEATIAAVAQTFGALPKRQKKPAYESERKVAKLPGLKTALGSGAGASGLPNPATLGGQGETPGAPTGGAASNQVQAVADVATPAAVDAQTSRLEGAINAVHESINEAIGAIGAVERAVGALKNNKAFANG